MQINDNDKKILIDMGYTEEDIEQIKRLRYKFTIHKKNGNSNNISCDSAKSKLSNRDFLSGLGRAAFHRTSFRTCDDEEKGILIESNLHYRL